MKRKILSVLLVISVLLPCFNVQADVETEMPASDVFLTALGIFSDVEYDKQDEYVKRSDAVYYALKVTGHGDIPKTDSYSFSDVTADTSNADSVQCGVSYGMIAQGETFSPDRNVTLSEFVKMVICGLGYTSAADCMGAYPEGYMHIANHIGMLKRIVLTESSHITYSELKKILLNVLASNTIEMVTMEEYRLETKKNVMYEYFDIYTAEGVLTANAVTSLSNTTGLGDKFARIGNTVFDVNEDVYYNLSGKLGYNLNVWVQEREDSLYDKILCYEVKKTEVEEVKSEDYLGLSGGLLKYQNGESVKSVKIPASCAIIYNGKAYTNPMPTDIFDGRWGNVKIIKPTGDEVKTVIFTVYENYYVGIINARDYLLGDNTANNRSVSFMWENELSEYAFFRDNLGNAMTFDKIPVGSVVSVAQNEEYSDVIVTTEDVSGILEDLQINADERTEIFVNGNHYTFSPEMNSSRVTNLKRGSKYTFYLDPSGKVSAAILTSSVTEGDCWAYLIDLKYISDSDEVLFTVLTSEGETPKLYGAYNMTVDGKTYRKTEDLIKKLSPEGPLRSQVVRLSVNADGEIKNMDTMFYDSMRENRSDSVHRICDFDSSETADDDRYWQRGTMSFNAACTAHTETVVFMVPEGREDAINKGDKRDYIATTTDVWSQDEKACIAAYNIDRYSTKADVIVWEVSDTTADNVKGSEYLTIVTGIKKAIGKEGDIVTVLTGYQGGSEQKWEIKNDDVLKISENDSTSSLSGTLKVGVGDAVRLHVDRKDDIVSKIVLLYDFDQKQQRVQLGDTNGIYPLPPHRSFKFGEIIPFRIFDGFIMAATDMTKAADADDQEYVTFKVGAFKVYEVEVENGIVKVSQLGVNDIKDWYSYGNISNETVLMQTRYQEGRTIVIYKD